MEKLSPKNLRPRVDDAIGGAGIHPDRIALHYALVVALISLAVPTVCFFLSRQIENASGLSGLGMRSMLETADQVIRLLAGLFLPFWAAGITFVGIRLAQDHNAVSGDLREGLRRFFPLLRLFLLEFVIFLGVGILCLYAGALLFSVTPLSSSMTAILEPILQQAQTVDPNELLASMDENTVMQLADAMRPALYISAGLLALFGIPLVYRLRMATFCMLSDPTVGAFASVRKSRKRMKGRRWKLFRLDLHFWWFYAMQIMLIPICYGDVILAAFGAEVPLPPEALYFGCTVLFAGGQFLLQWLASVRVETTYAMFYDTVEEISEAAEGGSEVIIPPVNEET